MSDNLDNLDNLNDPSIRAVLLAQGRAARSRFHFWRGVTKSVQKSVRQSTKGALTVDSGKRSAVGIFKASTDLARNDKICATLCSISVGCELVSGILVWCPIKSKVATVSVLKATSVGCQHFRDLCFGDPSSPLC